MSAQVVQVYEGTSYILVSWEAGQDHHVEVCLLSGCLARLHLELAALQGSLWRVSRIDSHLQH